MHDCYLRFVGTSEPNPPPGAGYEGPPLGERYSCPAGCTGPLTPIASLFTPDDKEMWLFDPHVPVWMTAAQAREWRTLIREAGHASDPPGKAWWWIW